MFTDTSIAQVFFVTAIAFAGLSLWGYTTKKDISGWGSFLIMGVIGLIVAIARQHLAGLAGPGFAVSAIGVLIFAGLTAYDTQNIKNTYLQMRAAQGDAYLGKAAIMGALSLYLNFINMFMILLQLLRPARVTAPAARRASGTRKGAPGAARLSRFRLVLRPPDRPATSAASLDAAFPRAAFHPRVAEVILTATKSLAEEARQWT